MIYLDQRGSGHSGSALDYHLSRLEADIDEVRRHFGLPKVCLVAHSFGGIIAVNYAAHHPDRVFALVLVNALLQFRGPSIQRMQIDYANGLLGTHIAPDSRDGPDALKKAHLAARDALMKSGYGYRFLTDDPASLQKLIQADDSYARNHDFGQAVIDRPEEFSEYYRDHALLSQEVRTPTLIIAGTRDHAVGPEEHMRFRFSCAQVQQIDGGHLLYFEASRLFQGAVQSFLAQRQTPAQRSIREVRC
ncbi:proline iminopeptidase [Lysobacter helvus]|uniref:Proline iminopeptidase n=3 Tax=Lysobacterales TaxID=135614 RepID=A0ABN6FUX0_9GAMM|nr:proline iminopeptidase [Lysobacter caseinilyticus]BCT96327.1 proline iminopeptidase [Lysobacter helvus]